MLVSGVRAEVVNKHSLSRVEKTEKPFSAMMDQKFDHPISRPGENINSEPFVEKKIKHSPLFGQSLKKTAGARKVNMNEVLRKYENEEEQFGYFIDYKV